MTSKERFQAQLDRITGPAPKPVQAEQVKVYEFRKKG